MFPVPPTLSWAGFGNHFQMGNNFKEEEQLKLWAILLPAPTGTSQPRPWNFPEVGRAGLSSGEKPGWAVETGCLAWLSCGQALAATNVVGYCLGAAHPCQALPSRPHSSSLSTAKVWHLAVVLQEMLQTHRRATTGTSQPHGSLQVRRPSFCNRLTLRKRKGWKKKQK